MFPELFLIESGTCTKEVGSDFSKIAQNYVSSGVVCHALLFLQNLNFLDYIKEGKFFESTVLDQKKSIQLMLTAALKELEINGILHNRDGNLLFSEFGKELLKYLGLIMYIYDGYSQLFINFFKDFESEKKIEAQINDEAIVKGSDSLASNFIGPFIMRQFFNLDIEYGTICDLGCGDCSRLNFITQHTPFTGLGIDISRKAVKLAQKYLRVNKKLKVMCEDITSLKNQFPEVNILMQTMVMHDFPRSKICEMLTSYLSIFPNMQYFFYCDVVAPCSNLKSLLPGFDYIHAMLGIKTKSYDETLSMFQDSCYEVVEEHKIDNLNNTFLWILKPTHSK